MLCIPPEAMVHADRMDLAFRDYEGMLFIGTSCRWWFFCWDCLSQCPDKYDSVAEKIGWTLAEEWILEEIRGCFNTVEESIIHVLSTAVVWRGQEFSQRATQSS